MNPVYTSVLPGPYLGMIGCLLSLTCSSQNSNGLPQQRTQGCVAYMEQVRSDICTGDSVNISVYSTCALMPSYSLKGSNGMLVKMVSTTSLPHSYVFSFPGPGVYAYTFNDRPATITVHDPLTEADPVPKTVFCKDDPPLVLQTTHSLYKLGTISVTAIDPGMWSQGFYTLTQTNNNMSGCRFELSHPVTIGKACASSVEPQAIVYQDPSADELIVPADAASTIRVWDMYGKVWCEQLADKEMTRLPLEHFPPGLFVVEFSSQGKAQLAKVIRL